MLIYKSEDINALVRARSSRCFSFYLDTDHVNVSGCSSGGCAAASRAVVTERAPSSPGCREANPAARSRLPGRRRDHGAAHPVR